MKVSARNQLVGKITEIIEGKVNSEIVIDVNGMAIKSVITNGSVKYMELIVGDTVTAIIKASQVIVSNGHPGKISTRNIIETKVENIINGAVNCELQLSVGTNLIAAIITEDAVKDLEIQKGDTVFALIKANSIILAK
ncbi:MAG: TOBE domain-containing protein [Arcobacteraceae bacterium]|jgi:molybdate transport system regulatory protein|nr:TOBE domain-containing protein [Arcobacteraceae bacterium]